MKKQFLQLNIKSNNKGIHIYSDFLISILKKLKIQFKYLQLPVSLKRITLLKSPHVNKKSREQFEFKTFKKTIIIQSNLKLEILKFLILNKPKFIKLNLRKII
jgi:small subunit ribosomal protein S10